MKIVLLACVMLFFSCTKQQTTFVDNPGADTIPPVKTIAAEQKKDTVQWLKLALNDSTTIEHTKTGYSIFKRWFNNMASKQILHPDKAWKQLIGLREYRDFSDEFGSEVGQDGFYMLYAYFLQKINGVEKHNKERVALFTAYRDMNHLKSYFQYGGTYFGHMHDRIYGYAEYSIYTLDKGLCSQINISNEKKEFITRLKKLYNNKLKDDGDTGGKEKPERLAYMMAIINHIDAQITNAYLLKEVKQFYRDHYDYWM